jgi:NAD(P)-dependent dehydrogenase (short-subunit alcohol dehydrogenase family)
MNEQQTGQPFDFSGATAVVLGGATGLGRAMAEGLASHGATVCIVSRSAEKAQAAADAIAGRFAGRCWPCAADVASEASIARLRDTLGERFAGRLNIAINSAGINTRNPIEQIALEEWESIQRVNITGAFLFAKAIFPLLKDAGWGRLINIASIFASRSFPGRTSYASSKGALLQLTRTLAIEWADKGVTANAISPGPFLTDMTRPVLDNPDAYRRFCEHVPMKRFAEPHELITACLFLASRASTFVTGAEIVVDGGWLAT